MSRSSLLNSYGQLQRKVETNIGGFVNTTYENVHFLNFRFMVIGEVESEINGRQTPRLKVKLYFDPNTDILPHDVLVFQDKVYEILLINPLSNQTGATAGIEAIGIERI